MRWVPSSSIHRTSKIHKRHHLYCVTGWELQTWNRCGLACVCTLSIKMVSHVSLIRRKPRLNSEETRIQRSGEQITWTSTDSLPDNFQEPERNSAGLAYVPFSLSLGPIPGNFHSKHATNTSLILHLKSLESRRHRPFTHLVIVAIIHPWSIQRRKKTEAI